MGNPVLAAVLATQKPAEIRLRIERHQASFQMWRHMAEILEKLVMQPRKMEDHFSKAIDLLFIAASKSHGSLFPLCIIGHVEDAATIARRLFEILVQVRYLCKDPAEREYRGRMYLAQYWHNARGLSRTSDIPQDQRARWYEQYQKYKKWLRFKNNRPDPHWSGLSLGQLAKQTDLQNVYRNEYGVLSFFAHCSPRGLMSDEKSEKFIGEILEAGTKYMLREW